MRARQIELQKRRLRMRGTGREFESLRDYQPGDEMRNISWTATARPAHLITREFTTERSQKVWIVLDAGRLSRTAFETRRSQPEARGEVEQDAAEQHVLTVTQLDQAASAAVMLAQVIAGSGDKFALMTYGRRVQQQLLPGAGPAARPQETESGPRWYTATDGGRCADIRVPETPTPSLDSSSDRSRCNCVRGSLAGLGILQACGRNDPPA